MAVNIKKINHATLKDELKQKHWKKAEVSMESAFRLGKCYVMAMLADSLHMSMTFEDFENALKRTTGN